MKNLEEIRKQIIELRSFLNDIEKNKNLTDYDNIKITIAYMMESSLKWVLMEKKIEIPSLLEYGLMASYHLLKDLEK